MTQTTIFNKFNGLTKPTVSVLETKDPHVATGNAPRLTGQNRAILARLRCGSATNKELSRIALKYTSRISDLREHGYTIACRRGEGGIHTYILIGVKG